MAKKPRRKRNETRGTNPRAKDGRVSRANIRRSLSSTEFVKDRLAGLSIREIAAKHKRSNAYVLRALNEYNENRHVYNAKLIEQLRLRQSGQLEILIDEFMVQAVDKVDTVAANTIIGLMQRMSKLWGLDAPEKVEAKTEAAVNINADESAKLLTREQMTAALLEARERARAALKKDKANGV